MRCGHDTTLPSRGLGLRPVGKAKLAAPDWDRRQSIEALTARRSQCPLRSESDRSAALPQGVAMCKSDSHGNHVKAHRGRQPVSCVDYVKKSVLLQPPGSDKCLGIGSSDTHDLD